MKSAIRILQAKPGDVETLRALHTLCFPADRHPDYSKGTWFLAYEGRDPVAFSGFQPEPTWPRAVYLSRAGVLPSHRGQRLQARLIRTRERHARQQGFAHVFTSTYENPRSANNLIRAGYLTYLPIAPWGAKGTVYWHKPLTP